MRRLLLLGLLAACGPKTKGTATPPPKATLSAKEIATQSNPAIVYIDVGEGDQRGAGTGFIIDQSGLIATNFHVVRGNSAIKVKLFGGETYKVSHIVGFDPGRDLALIRIQPAKALPVVKLGDSDQMSAGDQIVAIGNPLGLDHTVSSGLVSQVRPECTNDMVDYALKNQKRLEELAAKAQTEARLTEAEREEAGKLLCRQELKYFQISAPISQGSSGGPLFNQAGEVVGVTTAIITAGQNINLAIPTNYLKALVAKPGQIGLDEFAASTRDPAQDANPQIKLERKIPDHPPSVFDGCKGDQIVQLENDIWSAIGVGAPIYNKGEFEACFRIYEGVATKYENSKDCKGVKAAFGDGLVRVAALDYKGDDKSERTKAFKLKAWAMRDTFDGLLAAAKRWRDANPGKFDKSKLGPNQK
jgi:S1-C subfamily serine protease